MNRRTLASIALAAACVVGLTACDIHSPDMELGFTANPDGTTTVTGLAADQDQAGTKLLVVVTVDGTTNNAVAANLPAAAWSPQRPFKCGNKDKDGNEQTCFLTVRLGEEIAAASPDYRAYLLGAPNLFVNYGTIRFLAFAAEKYDLAAPDQLVPMLAEAGGGTGALILALPNHLADLQQIQEQFPNGTFAERKDARGSLLYVTYRIPAVEVARQLVGKP